LEREVGGTVTTSKFLRDTIQEALREYLGDGDGADELALRDYDRAVKAEAWDEGFNACGWWWEIKHFAAVRDDNNPYRAED
jgi:hypothetical protein